METLSLEERSEQPSQLGERDFKLGDDFWGSLSKPLGSIIVSGLTDSPDFEVEHYTHFEKLRVQTRRVGSYIHTIIFNEALVSSRVSTTSPLDIPGYVVASKKTDNFEEALGVHAGAHERLNEMGY